MHKILKSYPNHVHKKKVNYFEPRLLLEHMNGEHDVWKVEDAIEMMQNGKN